MGAPTVSRFMGGAPEQNKNRKKIGEMIFGEVFF